MRRLVEALNLEPHEAAALFPWRPILVCYRGSLAHGTHVPPEEGGIDDVDLHCAYIPDLEHYFGRLGEARGKDIKVRQYDVAAYELRHLAHLLSKGNPNVLSALWTKDYLLLEPEGEALIKSRDLFSSRLAGKSFGGYAFGQLKRMTSFHDSGEATCCDGEKFHTEGCALKEERGRGSTKKFATGFMGAKRKSLVAKFGYDTKNAAHLLRLLKMGIEFLSDGVLRVDRTGSDAEWLIGVKRGEYPLDWVNREANALFERLKDAEANSPLPPSPPMEAIDHLLVRILSLAHRAKVALEVAEVLKGNLPTTLILNNRLEFVQSKEVGDVQV